MRACIVTETYWPDVNGVAMTLRRLVNGLTEKGHQVDLVCTRESQREPAHISNLTLFREVRGVPLPGYNEVKMGLPAGGQLQKLWRSARPDVVYVATEGPLGWSAARLANKLGIPVTSGFHTNFHTYSAAYKMPFLNKPISRYLVAMHNLTRCTVVPTADQRDQLLEMGIHNVAVMGRGVDTQQFTPKRRSAELRASWGAGPLDPVMIYVGRIAEEKNLALTMQVFSILKSELPGLKFVMIGDGPSLPRLRKEYPEVIYAGRRVGDELGAYYASGDFFPFTSLTETFGNVILEAMASGLGVVGFDYAATRLHVRHGDNGMKAPVGDDKAFIAATRELMLGEGLLEGLRCRAHAYAQSHGWSSVVQVFEEILHGAMQESRLSLASG